MHGGVGFKCCRAPRAGSQVACVVRGCTKVYPQWCSPHTPCQNNLKELHALLKFLWPDVLAKQSEVQMALRVDQSCRVALKSQRRISGFFAAREERAWGSLV